MKYSTMVITDESQVPDGYVRISDFAPDKSVASYVSKLHSDGAVPAVKLMRTAKDHSGPVWVDRKITEQWLNRMTGTPMPATKLSETLNPGAVAIVEAVARLEDRVVRTLERIDDTWMSLADLYGRSCLRNSDRANGEVPFGWMLDGDGKMIQMPDEQRVIRAIIACRAEGVSYETIQTIISESTDMPLLS